MPQEYIPRSYANQGTSFLMLNPRSGLAVDMGLGKTVMTLTAIAALIECGETKPFLIVAPIRVARSTWSNECAKWNHLAHLTVVPIVGDQKKRLEALKIDAPIYTINYENLPWLADTLKGKWPFKSIVLDESTKVKNNRAHFRTLKDGSRALWCTGGERAKVLARVAFSKVRRIWLLTGTVAPNGLRDLWGQQWFIDGGQRLEETYSRFEEKYYYLARNGYDLIPFEGSEERIRNKITDCWFSLRAEDYLPLGEEIVNTIWVELPEAARKHYKDMERHLFATLAKGTVEAVNAAVKNGKCHQMANGAVYHDKGKDFEVIHDEKLEALKSVIEEAAGTPVIVIYKFKSDLARLQKAFPKGKAFDTRKKTEDDFRAGKIPVLFLHPDSAGHGIDGFQYVTNIVCLFSVDWNAETRAQAIARVGKVRQYQAGFTRPVFIHQIVARNTVDEDILDAIDRKTSIENALKEGLARRLKET